MGEGEAWVKNSVGGRTVSSDLDGEGATLGLGGLGACLR